MAEVFDAPLSGRNVQLAGVACAIGVFDGVHAGHALLIRETVVFAEENGCRSAVVTFDIDPDEMFAGGAFRKISSNKERILALSRLPVDEVAVVPFDEHTASLPPAEFLDGLFGAYLPSAVFVGRDFRFGKGAEGDVATLEKWGAEKGVEVFALDLLEMDGSDVKSTRVRRLLEEGDLDGANRLLGRPYSFTGEVRHGRGDGAGMGFATANLSIPDVMKVLRDGVYGGYIDIGGKRFKAAINVGIPPMFRDTSKDNLEVHALDFDGDLYGKDVTVEFVRFLRPMAVFEDKEQLVRQVESDIGWIRENL